MQCMLVNDNFLSLSAEIKKIQASVKQSGGVQANISQGPLTLGGLGTSGGYQVPLRGGLGSLKRSSNYPMSHSVKF